MRKTAIIMGLAMLAGCGPTTDAGNGPAADARAATNGSATASLQPGMWETTAQFTQIHAPGLPPQMAQALREAMSQPQSRTGCLTAERIGNPTGAMAAVEAAANASCRFQPNGFAGGTINVRGTCSGPEGAQQMSITGSYTATTMTGTIDWRLPAPSSGEGAQSIRFEGRMTARRTGECPAVIVDDNRLG